MSILIKTVRLVKPSSTNIARRNLTSRALMSTISDAVKKDHQEINEYAKNIREAADEDAKVRWQNQFTWELARHSIGEELVVYPAFAKHLGAKGQEIADKDRAEHQPGLKPTSPEFIPTLEALLKDLRQHIKEEENDDLPALENAISVSESQSLAKSFGRTKAFVPSRSHPSAPSKPPFETIVGLLTAPIDHLGDLFRKFPDETVSPNPSTK